MSVVEWARTLARFSLALAGSLLGWLIVVPISLLVPKRRNWVAVIGKQEGRFLDNTKYFFLQASQQAPALRLVWVSQCMDVTRAVRAGGFEALCYPDVASIWFLLRCGSVVVDETAWSRRGRYFLLWRAAAVQLWHGVGFKHTGASRWRHERASLRWLSSGPALAMRVLLYRLTGQWMHYALVACTSRFYRDAVFMPALAARHYPCTGYPRNDFGLSLAGKARAMVWCNVDATVTAALAAWQATRRKLVIVAPTFRESGAVPMQLDAANLARIDAFAEEHGVEFLFKFHPFERGLADMSGRHFHLCDRNSDIYPLLPFAAALVTDYSSISMDFLLLDKPLLFLIPEGDDYTRKDRQLQFDPYSMMPGPIVPDWPSLLQALLAEWTHDHHRSERAALRRKAFDELPQAEAVPKLLALMRAQGWITDPASTDKP